MERLNAAARLTAADNAAKKSAIEHKLKDARLKVNKLKFGTPEWEKAMEVVRDLVQQVNSLTDFGPYQSHEGDVFAPR